MNPDAITVIHDTITKAFAPESIPFPEVVKQLMQAGIVRYYVDLAAMQKTFYHHDGATHVEPIPYPGAIPKSTAFNQAEVINAIRTTQRGEIKYPEFLSRILQAGTVAYTAFLQGKQVHYYGANGETHVEHFPK